MPNKIIVIFHSVLLTAFAIPCSAQDNSSLWFIGQQNNLNTNTANPDKKNHISGALQDRAGNLWFGTSANGLFCYNGKTTTHFTMKDGLPGIGANPQLEDRQGRIWMGSGGQEYYYDARLSDGQGKTFIHVPILGADSGHFKYLPADNKSVFITGICEDRDGNMWFTAFDAGVYRYDGKTVTHFQTGELMQGIAADNAGNMWFNFTRYDGKTFKTISPWGNSNAWVMRTLKDKKGNLWFSVKKDGLYRYDGKEFTHYKAKDGLCNDYNEPDFLFEDRSGKIWAGTNGNGMGTDEVCLCYFDGRSFHHVTDILTAKELKNNYARPILGDKDGNIWIGAGSSLFCYDGRTITEFTKKVFGQ